MTMPPSQGCLSHSKDLFESLVAKSAKFQKLTGSANETEAAAHVFLEILPRDDNDDVDFEAMDQVTIESVRPYCVVFLDIPASGRMVNVASGGTIVFSLSAGIQFEVDKDQMDNDVMEYYAPSSDRPETAQDYSHYMDNILGEIAEEVAVLGGDSLNVIDQFSRESSAPHDKFSTGEYMKGSFFVSLGVEA